MLLVVGLKLRRFNLKKVTVRILSLRYFSRIVVVSHVAFGNVL